MPPSPALRARAQVVERGVQKALGLAAAGAGGHQRVSRHMLGRQTPPRHLLVAVAGAINVESRKEVAPRRAQGERQAHLQVGPLEPACRLLHKTGDQPVQKIIGWLKTRDQKLLQALLDVAGE